ncbi:Pr6Pr family membrane protein [Rhodobacteraceae bacterium N5(2021)]|uniref:Pr6Pr family membrane protein n=1 Tax=Gymnodinialimonas phycosphaerae TaxID=2841589 RepID=A0A975TTA6_9RHOB|nr:Pr6Pr family membrane protein [Gymnodinialimonas phycosphaerae]MBY4894609.1 Pr6Pr family membrane protein [Gymnodinialimonas phycosphaerae]
MFSALSPRARWTAMVIALLAFGSVAAMFCYNLDTARYGDVAATAWGMARFFTILTHLAVVITFATAALRRDGVDDAWIAALTLAMVIVSIVYHVLLSDITTYVGIGAWADQGLHSVVPVACVLWWIAFAPKHNLHYRDLPTFIVWPCVYVAYALARGARDGTYPYPFMDLSEKSSLVVATNLAGLLIVMLIGGVIFVMAARFADR